MSHLAAARTLPLALALTAALAFGLLAACEPTASAPSEPAVATPPPVAGLARVEPETIEWSASVRATGRLEADKVTRIGPRVDGIIEVIFVDEGDRVAAGDPLLRMRQVDYRLTIQRAEAELAAAEAESVEAAREHARARALHEKGVLSESRLEAVESARNAAQARRQATRAALDTARQSLADTVVRAPYAAVVTGRFHDEGAYLRTMAGTSSIVLEIMKTDVLDAVVHVSETQLAGIEPGTAVRLAVPGAERKVEAVVSVVGHHVDPTSHNVEIRMRVENTDGALRPGLFVSAELRSRPRRTLALERQAVLGEGATRWVLVDHEGRAVRRTVEVRDLDARRVEVLSGLAPGDVVLAGPGLSTLTEGATVAPLARAKAEPHVAP